MRRRLQRVKLMRQHELGDRQWEQITEMLSAFDSKLATDPQIRSILRKISSGKATFADTEDYAIRAGNLLGQLLSEEITDILPEDRETLCTALLKARHTDINDLLKHVQETQDKAQGVHLNPVKPKFPAERVQKLSHALVDPTVPPETIRRRANAPVATVAKSFHDDYIRENASIRSRLGLKPTIIRYGSNCCKWCSEVAGKYRFGEQPDGIFRRHDNCDCVIIYDNQVLRGRKTSSGRSKTWEEVKPEDVLAEGFSPKVFSRSEAAALQERMLGRLTLAGKRDIINLDSIELFNGSEKITANTKTDLDKALEPIPDKLLEQLSGFVSKITIADGRGYSSYNRLTHEIILDNGTGASSIVHELGHAFGDMLGLYDDEEFLSILSDGLNIDDWFDVLRMKHPYTGADVWVLSAEKFVDPYQGRIYADVSDVDWSAPIDKKCFREYISVGFDTFFSNPELLMSKDMKLYEFLRRKIYG